MTLLNNEIIERMTRSREATFAILDWVADQEATRTSPHEGFRPILWHLAHIGAFEEFWLLLKGRGEPEINPRYQVIFDPIRTPREESTNLPSRGEMRDYIAKVRSRVEQLYSRNTSAVEDLFALNLVLEHEYQHQETLSYLIQMLPLEKKARLARDPAPSSNTQPSQGEMVFVPGGSFAQGAGDHFGYDNEKTRHNVLVEDFDIDRFPVTNSQYLEFVLAGGYGDSRFWSEAGWKWKELNGITAPEYWRHTDGVWESIEMFEQHPLPLDHPVTGVSWHEAEAYARFVGKRLPTESEWEKAAGWDPESLQMRRFAWGDDDPIESLCNYGGEWTGTTPVTSFPKGESPYGCLDMTGNVWEWTSSTFGPYQGFKAHPYPEYSELWFDGDHRVLKGGSWMTRSPLLRLSFRNFFRPGFRFAFAGFRCVRGTAIG
jgi:gamma-glutamyl hercynylcysteine S-oxide synthase